MTATRLLDGLLVLVILCVWGGGAVRAATMYARGIHVIAVDRERTLAEGLEDLIALGAFGLWAYEVIACAWPLAHHLVPSFLLTVLFEAFGLQVLGAAMVLAGFLIWAAAMVTMGAAWRIGIDRGAPRTLVTHGIFAWTRNPIYTAFDLLVIGTFLLQGRLIFLVLALLLTPLFHLQIRREERFLVQIHGDAYRAYSSRVGRYVTISSEGAPSVR